MGHDQPVGNETMPMSASLELVAELDVRQLPTREVVAGFTAQVERFDRSQGSSDSYALELLRRALNEDDAEAWAAFTAQYRRIVLALIRRHACDRVSSEDEAYWIDRSMERFWRAIRERGLERFQTLGAVIQYLKLCAHSVLIDEVRARSGVVMTPLDETISEHARVEDMEAGVLGDLVARDLWQVIVSELRSDCERVVARLSFVAGLSPREIHERRPDCCPTVGDVYRIKRNLLERLRRNARIQAFRGSRDFGVVRKTNIASCR
ncbi:MAG: sigma-70 family RNA polymerase sigma factor [Chloroflexi bacterium]|nr:sigma-70 family RNA polymerase sigma factor [Chloroflexota bacterium]